MTIDDFRAATSNENWRRVVKDRWGHVTMSEISFPSGDRASCNVCTGRTRFCCVTCSLSTKSLFCVCNEPATDQTASCAELLHYPSSTARLPTGDSNNPFRTVRACEMSREDWGMLKENMRQKRKHYKEAFRARRERKRHHRSQSQLKEAT